jgi:transposase
MVFFSLGGVLRRFPAAAYVKYASPQIPQSGMALPSEKKFSFMNATRYHAIYLSWMGTNRELTRRVSMVGIFFQPAERDGKIDGKGSSS